MFIQWSLLTLFLMIQVCTASADIIHLELGEELTLSTQHRKIWIENKSILRARADISGIRLKPQKTGITRLRTTSKLYDVRISEPGTKKNFRYWQQLQNQFVDMSADYCQEYVCLKGSLFRLQDYARLLALMKQSPAVTLLALKPAPVLQKTLPALFKNHLRLIGLSPLKLLTRDPWTTYLPKEKFKPENIRKLYSLGVKAELLTGAVNTDENIKVSVRILEVSKNFERKIGVQWPDQYEARLLNWKVSAENENGIEIALNAAEKSGEARVLAAPTLLCRNGKEAEFFAGGEFPVKVLGLRSRQTSWKRYGIALKLKPHIDSLGQLSLSLDTEVSTLDRSISVDDMPALHTNRISSVFDLTNGKTIAISGLIKSEQSENSEGLPWLKNLPVLGSLFSSRNFQTNKSELVIFVTPSLME